MIGSNNKKVFLKKLIYGNERYLNKKVMLLCDGKM